MIVNKILKAGVATAMLLVVSVPAITFAGCPDTQGLKIIGEIEHVTFTSNKLRLKARIDTGAQTSSLGIVSQQRFERDGKKWVQFSVVDPVSKKTIEHERPLIRKAKIKRHAAEAQERPVVKMKIKLGDIELERQFTLTDRSQYKFPVLIGRNVLSRKFLVDVNQSYTTKRTGAREE